MISEESKEGTYLTESHLDSSQNNIKDDSSFILFKDKCEEKDDAKAKKTDQKKHSPIHRKNKSVQDISLVQKESKDKRKDY